MKDCEDIKICSYCGKEIVLNDNEYEEIDGELYCLNCVEKHFSKCDWCKEYVTHIELGWYGNILCCDNCAANRWREMEDALGWR